MGLRHGERWAAQGVGLGQAHEPLGLLQERCRPVRHQAWYAKFLFMLLDSVPLLFVVLRTCLVSKNFQDFLSH